MLVVAVAVGSDMMVARLLAGVSGEGARGIEQHRDAFELWGVGLGALLGLVGGGPLEAHTASPLPSAA